MKSKPENANIDFGIILTCYIGDYFFTKGLLASINWFLPDIPICIIQDGNFSIQVELNQYNVTHVIKKADVKDEFLRKTSFGTRCTNMIAFWESPFRHFLYIDSDTIVWGDIQNIIDYKKYDFIHNIPHEAYTEYILHSQYFDYESLFTQIPKIDVHKHHFFNAGVFAARRGIFDLAEYKRLYFLWTKDRSLFGPEPQGFINYLVYRGVEEGKIIVSEVPIQKIVPMFTIDELNYLYYFDTAKPVVNENIIIHWAGPKPYITIKENVFPDPMFFFRKQNLINTKSIWKNNPEIYFKLEEYKAHFFRHSRRLTPCKVVSKLKRIYRKLQKSYRVIQNK
jgi:hypothetical protein